MLLRPVVLFAVLLVAALPVFGAATADGDASAADAVITLAEGSPPTYEGPAGLANLTMEEVGERYAWRLATEGAYTVIEVRVSGAFAVERPRQVLPLLDGEYFVKLHTADVTEVDEPVRVVNVTGEGGAFVYRLGIPGPTDAELVLVRDVAPPGFEVGPVDRLTHYSFYVETTTTEPALARLLVEPSAGGEVVEHPTPSPAGLQRFPVQGLKTETEYRVTPEFEDWSGNKVQGESFLVRTLPEPERPLPVLTLLAPAADADLAPGDAVAVRVRVESPESPIAAGGLRVFVDKREQHGNFSFEEGVLTYAPREGWAPGYHSFSVEATNEAGGTEVLRGSFTLPAPAEAPAFGAAGLLVVCAAVVLALRRREG